MQVREVMTRDMQLAHPEMPIRDAALKMRNAGTGFLPVEVDDRLVGTVTDRDIVMRSTAEGKNPMVSRVAEVMSPGLVYCYDDQDVRDSAAVMAENQVRRLPVLSREKRLVGVVSIGDIAEKAHDDRLVAHTIEQICAPSVAPRNVHGLHPRKDGGRPAPNGGVAASSGWFPAVARATTELGNIGRRAYETVEQGVGQHPLAMVAGALTFGALLAGFVSGWRPQRQASRF